MGWLSAVRCRNVLRSFALGAAAFLSACLSQEHSRLPAIDPDVARAQIAKLVPAKVGTREGWAIDIYAAFEALKVAPSNENTCAVIALTQQESTFQVNPTVPGLPALARREIDARADRLGVPKLLVDAALHLRSADGKTYSERLAAAHTEKELSELFEDFIGMVPLGSKLFSDWNPVRTGGPMQVSVAYAEQHAQDRQYPYPVTDNIRHEVFTRRGGLYFGIAHLFDYPAKYDQMLWRFADYNAGHYASRNAAFQNALSIVSGTPLSLDGDLVIPGAGADHPSNTELAVRKVASRLKLSAAQIHDGLEKGKEDAFDRTKVYERIFEMADKQRGKPVPRAVVPRIRLQSAKITRTLTTEWFANRVNDRYRQCLARAR